MRRAYRVAGFVATMAAVGVSAAASGCIFHFEDDCEAAHDCASGTSTTGSSSSSSGTGGDDGGPPPGCIPSDNVEAVANTCGVFVSSSLGNDTTGKGTKDAPFATITHALANAKGKPVYACGELFEKETVAITEDAALYGALDCTKGWVHDASKKTQLAPTMDAIPLTISKATTSVELYDFAIKSANAMQDGGSSIAVLVAQATASFTRCDIVAGDGAAGSAGAPYQMPAQAGTTGNKGTDACSANSILGADSVASMCGNPDSISGNGGQGGVLSGGPGGDGQPGTTTNGGKGEGTMPCQQGNKGDDGDTISLASPGLGATGIGTLSASGYTGVTGGAGGSGTPGQGGGGGGGSKGGTGAGKCTDMASAGGASGGSGGSGGCGGQGGKGGGAGGSSIALLSIDATLSFANVTLKAGAGGNGGDGGPGQTGGMGGTGGSGGKAKMTYTNLNDGCPGGDGGKGGTGGKGGGGLGGHSLGLAFTGKAPPTSGWTATPGSVGKGGVGDSSNMGDGAPGLGCKSLDFADAKTCTM